jgi:hypothetical protein
MAPGKPAKRKKTLTVALPTRWSVHGFSTRGNLLLAVGILCTACQGSTTLHGHSANDAGLLATWDGGLLPPTPGLVRCGAMVCAEGYRCCVREGRGDPPSVGCDRPSNLLCNGALLDRTCDETADCASGELCYWETQGVPQALTSYCQDATFLNAWAYSRIGCGSESDCDAVGAPACVAQECRGDIIQTCGYLPSDWCPPGRE